MSNVSMLQAFSHRAVGHSKLGGLKGVKKPISKVSPATPCNMMRHGCSYHMRDMKMGPAES